MYSKFIKLVVLLNLLVCCGLAGRVLYSHFFNLVVQGKDPHHTEQHLSYGHEKCCPFLQVNLIFRAAPEPLKTLLMFGAVCRQYDMDNNIL